MYAIIHVVHRGLSGPAPEPIVLMGIDFAWERKDLGQKDALRKLDAGKI
jgi:hypothetical protein